jgi:hypothetical protein
MTSQPGRRAAAVQSCSDALEVCRPSGDGVSLFGLGRFGGSTSRKMFAGGSAAAPPCDGRHFRNDGGDRVRRAPAGDRVADRDRTGADAPSHDHPLRRLVLSLVVKRRILSAIGGALSPHAKRRQTSVASHVASDGRAVGGGCLCEISDFASRHDGDAVGEFQYLVEVLRYQQNGGASVTLLHDLRPNVGD